MAETIVADEADDLVEELLACTDDPLRFVQLAFPDVTPEKWQREVLSVIGLQLRENAELDRWKAIQIAVASGNGIGKTALLSWIVLWSLITFEETLGVVTAGTEGQLRVRLWPEISKWHAQLPEALRAQFELTATQIFNRQSPLRWRISATPWTERNREAFSGLHNFRKRVVVVYDECSMIPEQIWLATTSMLSDAETEIIWCVFGNPTRTDGMFPMLFPGGKFAPMWAHFRIDSRDVSLTDKAAIQEKLSYYGPESNYARSHVYGLFPLATASQLIPTDRVEAAAVRREALAHPTDSTVIGVDVASGHGTDVSVVAIRKGFDARSFGQYKFPGVDPMQLAYEVAAISNSVGGADAIHIDATGVGEGPAARLRELGLPVHPVYLGSRAPGQGDVRCANMRAFCWTSMAAWLKVGAIVNDAELKAQICAPSYGESAQGLVIEKKEHMRDRGLASPDCADALSLTFAFPVFTAAMGDLAGAGDYRVVSEYNPWSDEALRGENVLPEAKKAARYYAPGYARLKSDDWSSDELGDALMSDRLRMAKEETN